MKIYKTQEEVEKDIVDGVLNINGDVKFECSINIDTPIIAGDIIAGDIIAWDINAWDISYYSLCLSYNSIKCTSIEARRNNHQKPICLDGELAIVNKEDDATEEAMKLLKDKGYKIIKN